MRLRDIAKALPPTEADAATVAQWAGSDESFIRDKLGIASRHYLASGETGTDLSAAACRRLFERHPEFDPATVELLVVVTQNPDYRIPHNAALLQERLGLPQSCAAFDIGLGCSGFVYALSVARAMMLAEGWRNALVVTCDPYSKIMGRADRDTVPLFGDAAASAWLSTDAGAQIGRGDFGTDGSGAGNLILPAGGAVQPLADLWADGVHSPAADSLHLHMNGRAIFNFMMTRVPQSISRCLERNGLKMDDVDMFVFHQASTFLLKTLAGQLKLPEEKVPIRMDRVGNTVSSSIPLTLAALAEEGRLGRGKTVLVSGFGVGLSWASNILTWGD